MASIAVFVPSLEGGGAERVMVSLANLVAERHHAVTLITAKTIDGAYTSLVSKSVRIHALRTGTMWRTVRPLAQYLTQEQPDALIATLAEANMVALLARRLARVPSRTVIREANTPTLAFLRSPKIKKRITGKLIPKIYPFADAIVAVSTGVLDDLRRLLPSAQDKISLIYNPVLTPDLSTLAQEPLSHPWFQPKERAIVLAAGRLTHEKDHSTLVQAFARVRQKIPARLVILGEGAERANLLKQAHTLGVAEDFDLPGFDPNPFKYMARSDVFVLSSRYEGLPNVLIQAMACGCPVVSTNCPSGPEDILDGGKYGELVPVGDVEAIASAIERVLRGERKPVPPEWIATFEQERVVSQYLKVLIPNA